MTTITLEVPDALAARLDLIRDRLPELLAQMFDTGLGESKIKVSESSLIHPVFQDMIGFLATGPTSEQIIAHKASPAAQERLEELLDKNREEGLTEAESEEMDAYELVNDLMILLKARAHVTKQHYLVP